MAVGRPLVVTVTDEDGVAVPSAKVTLSKPGSAFSIEGRTNFAGRWVASGISPGTYLLGVEKEGFFAILKKKVTIGKGGKLDISLNHRREYVQKVNVVYSPPMISPTRTASIERLSNADIINLPYPVTRDIRYVLPYLPGVLQDGTGQLHIEGSKTSQIEDRLDGFDMSDPASGHFDLRVSVDAIRSATVESTRIPAQYGEGSGGLLSLDTGMGDNHLRFKATDFFPQLQTYGGLHIENWFPRFLLSGPIRKGKAWFLVTPQVEYSSHYESGLPAGANHTSDWRFANLAKFQVNLTEGNILTGTYVANRYRARHYGLNLFDPVISTSNLGTEADFFSLKDQAYLKGGSLLELGAAFTRFRSAERPEPGNQTYVITPEGVRGNYYVTSIAHSRRVEGIANLFLKPFHGGGTQNIRVGADLERITFEGSTARRPYKILRETGALSQRVSFLGPPKFARDNFSVAGYVQDQWLVSPRLTVAGGLRLDWDEIVRRTETSPRLATSWLLTKSGSTKLVAGVGQYTDVSNLDLLTQPLQGERLDSFYGPTGQTPLGLPAETSFEIRPGSLLTPRVLNWSVGLDRRLPGSVFVRAEFLQKIGSAGWTYVNTSPAAASSPGGLYVLTTTRRDRYHALKVSARKAFGKGYVVFGSYEHSQARTNQALDFNLDNPVFGPQVGGPLPWDSPNRFISWGWLPLTRGFNLGYTLDARTGFPYDLVNQKQQLVAPPGARRFPEYFTLNVAVERRIGFLGFEWALRAGFDDVTNRHNATAVDNNVDSPHFLELSGLTGRALVARLRLLGRK